MSLKFINLDHMEEKFDEHSKDHITIDIININQIVA